MRRPPSSTLFPTRRSSDLSDYEGFAEAFRAASVQGGKPKQYLVPYFIASHPGSGLTAMIDLALFLDRKSTRLNSSHANISYAVFCLKKKTTCRTWPHILTH